MNHKEAECEGVTRFIWSRKRIDSYMESTEDYCEKDNDISGSIKREEII
jgi:hypothetical protein